MDKFDFTQDLDYNETLKEILQALKTIAYKWRHLGVYLDVPPGELKGIEVDNGNVQDRLHSVIEYWLKSVNHPTKESLLNALELADENNLAEKLREEWRIARSKQLTKYGQMHPPLPARNDVPERSGSTATFVTSTRRRIIQSMGCSTFANNNYYCLLVKLLKYVKHPPLALKSKKAMIIVTVSILTIFVGSVYQYRPSYEHKVAHVHEGTTATNKSPSSNSLPFKLIGRDKEVEDIQMYLRMGGSTVVDIIGPPGVGKSALARYIAHEFRSANHKVYFMDMQRIQNMDELKREILKQASLVGDGSTEFEHWADGLSQDVLLVLDNCDHHFQDYKKFESLRDLLITIQRDRLKLIITNQALPVEDLHLRVNVHSVSLNYFDYRTTHELLRWELKDLASRSEVSQICSLIDGMPLAVKNIKDLLTDSGKEPIISIKRIISQLISYPMELFTRKTSDSCCTVSASIGIAYNHLSDYLKECGGILASLHGEFSKERATSELKHESLFCVSDLFSKNLLEHSQRETKFPVCYIDGANYSLQCTRTNTNLKEYRFQRLIKEYFLQKLEEKRMNSNETDSAKVHEDVNDIRWESKEAATSREYCPHHYMHLECTTSWQTLYNQVSTQMNSTLGELTTKDAIEIGKIGTYWGRVVLKDLLDTTVASNYIKSSLALLEQREQEHEFTAERLTAYVFYIHHSLGIKWSLEQGCTCPLPQKAISTMIRSSHMIELMYSGINNDHMAWAARKSFYIDLYCCCTTMNYEDGCEHLWKIWMRGIVSQIATTNVHFSQNQQQCKTTSLPVTPPDVVLGLWHYSFTQNFTLAKKYLELALNHSKEHECPIREIAIVMALHMIHTATRMEDLTNEFIETHLKSRTLVDYHLPNYKMIYEQVVIPFLHEIGKGVLASSLQEELSVAPSNYDERGGAVPSYDCGLFYWHHDTSYTNFLCLTL